MRWATGLIAGVALLALGGCRSQDPGPPALAVPAEGLRCEVLLPPEVREPLLPGGQLHEERRCATCAPVCSLRAAAASDTVVSVAYDCRPRVDTDALRLLQPTLRAGGEEVPALGRAGARMSPAPGMLQVITLDDDTPCQLVITWLGAGSERALELARVALHAANPDTVRGIAPPPPIFFGPEPDAGP
ncbi:MAG TPA: hypothetical protein VFO83_11925 [Aggregicoccus sp.]|nr:hypothetical protein [Aggregicoccus sp.]